MFKNSFSENDSTMKAAGAGGAVAKQTKPALARQGSARTALGDISNRTTKSTGGEEVAGKEKGIFQKLRSSLGPTTASIAPSTSMSSMNLSASVAPSATSSTQPVPVKRTKIEGKSVAAGGSRPPSPSQETSMTDPDTRMSIESLPGSSTTSEGLGNVSSASTTAAAPAPPTTAPSTSDPRPTALGVMKEQRKLDAELQFTSATDTDSLEDVMDTSLEESVSDLTLSEIDSPDRENPQMVTDYIQDIVAYFRKTEARRHPAFNYMSKQTDINAKMREILIDWLVEVHLKFKLCLETLYLTVNIIDRFLERRAVKRTKLQLVGCTAMLIASKYEEIYAPEVKDFVYISDKAYNHEQILAMESIMLNTLKFNLTVPSALRFAERFVKVSGGEKELQYTTEYLLELTLQKYSFLKYLPSMVAASAVFLAQKMTKIGSWNATLAAHAQYTEAGLEPCVRDLIFVATQKNPRYCAVRKKFANPKYGAVSKLKVWTPED